MAKRYIGDAIVTIAYDDVTDSYVGSVKASDHARWKFRDLKAPVAWNIASDSSVAYDKMAQAAVSFASYYTTHNRGDDVPDWVPAPEIADAIEYAVASAMFDNGDYDVRRKP
jgi:hypothetical protein